MKTPKPEDIYNIIVRAVAEAKLDLNKGQVARLAKMAETLFRNEHVEV